VRDAAEGWALPERTTKAWARNDLKDLENYPEWCGCLNTVGERDTYGRLGKVCTTSAVLARCETLTA
jgi:hypothetical protein